MPRSSARAHRAFCHIRTLRFDYTISQGKKRQGFYLAKQARKCLSLEDLAVARESDLCELTEAGNGKPRLSTTRNESLQPHSRTAEKVRHWRECTFEKQKRTTGR